MIRRHRSYFAYYTIVIILLFAGCSIKSSQNSGLKGIQSKKQVQQVVFRSNRIFLNLVTGKNDTLRFIADTGGGNFMRPQAAKALNLKIDTVTIGGRQLERVNFNRILAQRGIPTKIRPTYIGRGPLPTDGNMGAAWFANKTWDFEYKAGKLFVVDSINWNQMDPAKIIKVGFKKNAAGNRLANYPRIPIVVDGDTIQVLFDTGATAILSKNAKPYFNHKKMVGTSFIISSIFAKWHANHPDWEFINNADKKAPVDVDMIKVPAVIIAGQKVGPVWFTERPDKSFTKFMSQYTDRQVQGAIGGSAFQYFGTIILDYPKEIAYFQRQGGK